MLINITGADMVLIDNISTSYYFIYDYVNMIFPLQRSVSGGLGSQQAEILADTSVALASANIPLVSIKLIGRLLMVSDNLFLFFF